MNSKRLFNNFLKIFETKATMVVCAVVVFVFVFAPAAFALETGLQYGTASGLGTQDLRVSIMKIIRIILGFVGIIAILITLYAGFIWMTSGGNADKIDTAKRTLRNAVIGLVIIFSAFAIVSFIIGALEGALTQPGLPGGQPPDTGCVNCGHLGGGIIESVYPTPFQRDVPRNTNIQVTFKVPMQPNTIIDGAPASCSVSSPCQGELVADNVKIFKADEDEDDDKLAADEVVVTSTDGKTFIMDVIDYLGDSANKTWYSVKLDNDILKDNGQLAFPGVDDFFLWQFEVGTFLDLDPVEVLNVFPAPDDASDDYDQTSPQAAFATLTVLSNPIAEVVADVDTPVVTAGTTAASVSGTYNGSFNGNVRVTINPGSNTAEVFWETGSADNNSAAAINNNTIGLGSGLLLTLSDGYAAGNQWTITVTAARPADTLRIGSRLYTFVSGTAATNQIQIGNTLTVTAGNIVSALADNLDVEASNTGPSITVTAKLAGSQGNSIVVQTRGTWSDICSGSPLVCNANQNNLARGANQVLTPTTNDAPDQPKNSIISIDFNEPIDVSKVSNATMIVQYEATPGNWQTVNGVYLFSNQYKTVEFLSENACTDVFGNPVINSCGEGIFCLPTVSPDPDPYQATHYRVIVKAGLLKECASNSDCSDPNFNTCVATGSGQACQGTFDAVEAFYPETRDLNANGITDAANNSFNGNKDEYVLNGRSYGKADGPAEQSGQAEYNLNDGVTANLGDDLVWYFYINKTLNLVPPKVSTMGPTINQSAISLTEAPNVTFDKLVSSSSLKPGNNYRDGFCYCQNDSECNQTAGETCDTMRNKCVNANDDAQTFCEQDNECETNRCDNKKYVTLIDRATPKVGWWTTKEDLDTGTPRDGYGDQTRGSIRHTIFNEITNYGAEFGSGVKDIYQNCYFPGGGPDVGPLPNSDCPVTVNLPYCCNGVAYSQADWENTSCFTGY
ncbi:MAG: TrbC/VirB2 family protein [Candidatus Buchananbacteria bacterium]|nr:TrbC/VirB2 family protein [Candidatus Buchananbacteria bacterium]